MKGKETKKEKKKENIDGIATKGQSDYQKDKTRKPVPNATTIIKPKK